ncbi:MAG: hypothetical protein COB17_08720 [Sulfurimonas sp.]|nr:MAG: hypothetical protein COB17_08720 [Sulfurimonas sp.]
MCNFNTLNNKSKENLKLFITNAADSIGGMNFLLALIESMKENKPNALMHKKCLIESNELIIKWNKIVFKDKLDVLEDLIRFSKDKDIDNFNILDVESDKNKKKILNMVKALAPIEFEVFAKNPENGNGFKFKIFEYIKENNVKINPNFAAMFFCSIEFMKKALKYTI